MLPKVYLSGTAHCTCARSTQRQRKEKNRILKTSQTLNTMAKIAFLLALAIVAVPVHITGAIASSYSKSLNKPALHRWLTRPSSRSPPKLSSDSLRLEASYSARYVALHTAQFSRTHPITH